MPDIKNKAHSIYQTLKEIYPEVECELNFTNMYELVTAVILSAQTTDKRVNMVTPTLFKKYPTIIDLSNADENDVYNIICELGLAKNKTKNIIAMAKTIVNEYHLTYPKEIEELIKIPGIGRKTANVIISEGHKLPGFPVDTHIHRLSKRLGLVNESQDVYQTELKLKELFDPSTWHYMHLALIIHGRRICNARKPLCNECPLKKLCIYQNK